MSLGFVKLVWYGMEGPGRSTYDTWFLVSGDDDHLLDMLVGSRTICRKKILSWQIATVWPTQTQLPVLVGSGKRSPDPFNRPSKLIYLEQKHVGRKITSRSDENHSKVVINAQHRIDCIA